MKKLILLSVILFSSILVNAQNQFEKIIEMKGVDVVYISKAMLNSSNVNNANMNLGGIVGKLNSITIIDSEDKNTIKSIKKEIDLIIKSGKYEQIMYIKDDDSRTVFYSKVNKDAKNNEVLMVEEDKEEISIIRVEGDISAEDIKKLRY